jgi:hypothetical protein
MRRKTSRGDRRETMMVNALDFYGIWKLFNALCDAAFYGKNREYALGQHAATTLQGPLERRCPRKRAEAHRQTLMGPQKHKRHKDFYSPGCALTEMFWRKLTLIMELYEFTSGPINLS